MAHKKNVILSCSHVFHEHCIGNFEKFLKETVSSGVGFKLILCIFLILVYNECTTVYWFSVFRVGGVW